VRVTAVLARSGRGRVYLPLRRDPGVKHVTGTINDMPYRGEVETIDGNGLGLVLGPAWRRDCGLDAGDRVVAVLSPEGPQRGSLAADFEVALSSSPAAAACWDGLAQFYRKAYLRYIDATTRSPDLRVARIAEVVALLEAGVKERPKG